MRCTWLVGLVVTGCTTSVAGIAPVALRVEPTALDLDVDIALLPPTAAVHVFAVESDGGERDVTSEATFAFDGPQLGAIAAGTMTSDGLTGGVATMRITYGQQAAAVPVTAHVHGHRVVDGTPQGAAAAFAAATPTAVDAHLDPSDGAVLPSGLGGLVLSFAAADLDDVHHVVVTAPYLDLEILAPGVAGPREVALTPNEWGAIARTARGSAVQLEVASLQSSAPAIAQVTTVGLDVADLDPSALVFGGTTSAATDASPTRPWLWRYDMHAASAAQMFANPTGSCIGCHVAVSADGSRIAAVIITPAGPSLNGVVLDTSGTVIAQSDPASAMPWATAAFDPGGQLLAGWQGNLTLRDAATGQVLAPIAMTETAAAPTISPDGTALAYVTLDSGFGDAASQPVGNALHVRPWSATAAAVGPSAELVRDSGGVVLPSFSSDGQWIAFGHTIDSEVPASSAAVRADGSGTTVLLTSDPLDQLAHWASPVATARAGDRAPEPMVWVSVVSTRPVGGGATSTPQLWLEAFYPERGAISPAFHLPGQPAALSVLHSPVALPN